MTKEEYKNKIEQNVKGLKVVLINSEKGNQYSAVVYSVGDKEFQFVGMKLKDIDNDFTSHVEEIKYTIEKISRQ